MPNKPVVVDLGMSDIEYLQCLAQGQDPVKHYRDKSYESALLNYGVPATEAQRVAPLFEKLDCSIEEKILVNQALRRIWQRLTIGMACS